MKKIFAVLLIVLIISLCACGQDTQKDNTVNTKATDPTKFTASGEVATLPTDVPPDALPVERTDDEVYADYLSDLYAKLQILVIDDTHMDGFDLREGMIGVFEIALQSRIEIMSKVGYAIIDINSDGTKELLLCEVDEFTKESCIGTRILCAYTVSDGEPVLLFEGGYRNSYYLLDDMRLFNEGAESAAKSGFGCFELTGSEAALSCVEFYLMSGNDDMTVSYYRNETGSWDTGESEVLDVDEAGFMKIIDDLKSHIQTIDLTPMEAYEG